MRELTATQKNNRNKLDKQGSQKISNLRSEQQNEYNFDDIYEQINTLEELRKNCEKNGKYVDAQMAQLKIEELKDEELRRRREYQKQQNLNNKLQLEEAHLMEFNQFNEFWDRKMEEFNQEAQQLEQETLSRHQDELKRYQEELEKQIPERPKDSTELLNLRNVEANLAKQKDYIGAHRVQLQCKNVENEENEKWMLNRDNKIKNQIQQLAQKQLNEINTLRKRITSAQEEQRKNRSIELERLLQKYQNMKKELENQQTVEQQRLEKFIKNKTNTSVYNKSLMSGKSNQRIRPNSGVRK